MTASINRRQFLLTGLSTMAIAKAGAVNLAHDFPDAGRLIEYDIVWHSKPIGKHLITITQGQPHIQIDHEVEIHVSVLFVTALSLAHKSSEKWENGQLIGLSANTVKNDQEVSLSGRQDGSQFVLKQPGKKLVLPANIATTDSFWLMSSVNHNKILDARSGQVLDLKKNSLGKKTMRVHDNDYEVDGYHVEAGGTKANLWYHGDYLLASDVSEDGQTAHMSSATPL
jgi:hypothetical protein